MLTYATAICASSRCYLLLFGSGNLAIVTFEILLINLLLHFRACLFRYRFPPFAKLSDFLHGLSRSSHPAVLSPVHVDLCRLLIPTPLCLNAEKL